MMMKKGLYTVRSQAVLVMFFSWWPKMQEWKVNHMHGPSIVTDGIANHVSCKGDERCVACEVLRAKVTAPQ